MPNYLDESPSLPMQLQEMAIMIQAFNNAVTQDLQNARSGAAFLEKLSALVNSHSSVSIETVNGVVTVPSLSSIAAQLSATSMDMHTLTDATTTSVQNALYDAMTSLNTLASTITTQMSALQNDFVTHSQSLVVNAVNSSIDAKISAALPTPSSFPITSLGVGDLLEGQMPIRAGNNVSGYTPLTYWQRVYEAEIYKEL